MIDYKIIKFCKFCRVRFVVHKVESKRNLCKECQAKYDKGIRN
ncbi:MAG TPA: hypothetical protein VJI52_05475 [Candidatus Nanoarchaeia archaeon]|nr:hypothetical protein [Candidatus Nanoarchaeia archaeon]